MMETKYKLSPKTAAEVMCKEFRENPQCLEETNRMLDDFIASDKCEDMIYGLINFGVWRSEMIRKQGEYVYKSFERQGLKSQDAIQRTSMLWGLTNDVGTELAALIQARLLSAFYNCQKPD